MSLMNNSTPLSATQYTYDSMSRVATVSDGTDTFTNSYVSGSKLLGSVVATNTSGTILTTSKTYDTAKRLLSTSATFTGGGKSYTYEYNDKDQRTKLTLADGSYWLYSYDDKGQVTGGVKYDSTGKAIPGLAFGYSFDDIGNRIYADKGMPQMRYNYTSNDLNQYTEMTVPAIIPVTGKAVTNAKVTITKSSGGSVISPTRDGEYFSTTISVDNSSSKVTENLTINAVKYDPAQDKDVVAATSRTATAEQTPQTFTYDDDGNMLTNGDWTYTWNAENRLISAEKPDQKLEFAYDYKGRRIYKKVYTGTTGNWTLAAYKKFVYDNFVQIAEYDAMTSDTLKKSYLRGLDESLLSVKNTDAVGSLPAGATLYYNLDGNKNVRSMIDGGGTVVAEYEYSPFGKLIGRRGLYSLENPFRFSSEYHDDETGLVYYNYRYYSTELGRWLSRDPIEENGGFNLYGMVNNNAVLFWDSFGLSKCPRGEMVREPAGFLEMLWYLLTGDKRFNEALEYAEATENINYSLPSRQLMVSIHSWIRVPVWIQNPDGTFTFTGQYKDLHFTDFGDSTYLVKPSVQTWYWGFPIRVHSTPEEDMKLLSKWLSPGTSWFDRWSIINNCYVKSVVEL